MKQLQRKSFLSKIWKPTEINKRFSICNPHMHLTLSIYWFIQSSVWLRGTRFSNVCIHGVHSNRPTLLNNVTQQRICPCWIAFNVIALAADDFVYLYSVVWNNRGDISFRHVFPFFGKIPFLHTRTYQKEF